MIPGAYEGRPTPFGWAIKIIKPLFHKIFGVNAVPERGKEEFSFRTRETNGGNDPVLGVFLVCTLISPWFRYLK